MNTPTAGSVLLLAAQFALALPAAASVTQYTDFSAWQSAVGSYTIIDFTGFQPGTVITTQYQFIGVTFTDGDDSIDGFSPLMYPQDGAGLQGWLDGTISVDFDTPQYWVGVHHPGLVWFQLFSGDSMIYSSATTGSSGTNFFGGYVSSQPFDRVVLPAVSVQLYIDNLYFGPPVPAPAAALPLLGLGLLAIRRRRA